MRVAFFAVDAGVFLALWAWGADAAVVAAAGVAAALFLAIGWTFSSLRVVVDATQVRVAFGAGWPHTSIPLADVVAAAPARNRWWWGFGIRYTPSGWMWNVSGLDAVVLDRRAGRAFRIGTDDPQGLAGALRAALPADATSAATIPPRA